jgi:phytol kinase
MAAFVLLLGGLRWFQRQYSPHPELPRKILHAGSGLLTLSFPFLFDRLWPVLLLTGGSASLIAAIKFLKPLRKPLGGVVDGVSRTTLGEIYFPISVAVVFWLSLGRSPLLFCVPILVLTLADATGALVGLRYGQTRFEGASKSVEGSIAFLIVAFLCIHIPLLLWTTTGRAETLLIAFTMALLVMLLEGSAWRGLDNLFIPIGGFFLLQAYLPLELYELSRRFVVTLILVMVVLISRRSTTMLDDSLLAGAFLCYVTWALAGWRWIVPPAIGFMGFSLYSPDAPNDGRRFHTVAAMLSIWTAAIAWLVLALWLGEPALLSPFTLVFATHVAIFSLSRTAHIQPTHSLTTLAASAVLRSWLMLLLPFVATTALTARGAMLALWGGIAVIAGVALFTQVELAIRDAPQTLARWTRQTLCAAAASIVGWLGMAGLDRWT